MSHSRLSRFFSHTSGQFGLMAAVLALPLVLAIGMAVDFSRMVDIRTNIQSAADAATLAAVSSSGKTSKAGGNFTTTWTSEQAEREALNFFEINLTQSGNFQVSNPHIQITRSGLVLNASMTVQVNVPATFMSIVGLATKPITV